MFLRSTKNSRNVNGRNMLCQVETFATFKGMNISQ